MTTVTATTAKERHLIKLARRYDLTIVPVGNNGAVRVVGRDVDVIASRLSAIELRDITPNHSNDDSIV